MLNKKGFTEYAETLILMRGLGYSQGEIAESFDITQRTVSNWLHKLKELKEAGEITVSIGVEINEK